MLSYKLNIQIIFKNRPTSICPISSAKSLPVSLSPRGSPLLIENYYYPIKYVVNVFQLKNAHPTEFSYLKIEDDDETIIRKHFSKANRFITVHEKRTSLFIVSKVNRDFRRLIENVFSYKQLFKPFISRSALLKLI